MFRRPWEDMEHAVERALSGWREAQDQIEVGEDGLGFELLSEAVEVDSASRKRAWTRLIAGPLL